MEPSNNKFVLKLFEKFRIELYEMLKKDDYTDITIECQGGAINAHKLVLYSGSPYFQQIFDGDYEENHSNRLIYPTICKDIMEMVISFFYFSLDSLPTDWLSLMDLYKAAHLLQIALLTKKCCCALINSLDDNNCFEIWNFGDEYQNTEIINAARCYIVTNLKCVMKTSNFLKIDVKRFEDIINKMNSSNLKAEDYIIRGLLAWVKNDVGREKHFIRLLNQFSRVELADDFIETLIQHEPLVNENVKIPIIILQHQIKKRRMYVSHEVVSPTDESADSSSMVTEQFRIFQENLSKVVNKATYADITIEYIGGTVKAHRTILCSGSIYFQKMFENDCKETRSNHAKFPTLTKNTMDIVLSFMYFSLKSLPIQFAELKDLFKAAHLLQLDALLDEIPPALVKTLDLSNCLELWNLGDEYEIQDITNAVITYVVQNFQEVMKLETFHDIEVKRFRCIINKMNDLKMKTTDTVIKFLIMWAKQMPEREKCFPELMVLFEQTDFSDVFLQSIIKSEALINESVPVIMMLIQHLIKKCNTLLSEKQTSEEEIKRFKENLKSKLCWNCSTNCRTFF